MCVCSDITEKAREPKKERRKKRQLGSNKMTEKETQGLVKREENNGDELFNYKTIFEHGNANSRL